MSYQMDRKRGGGISGAIKNYFGFVPMSGAAYGTGSTYMAAFGISAAKDFVLKQMPYIFNGGDALYAVQTSIERGYQAAGPWAVLGGMAGFLIAYKCEKSLKDLLAAFFGSKK
jgi:hypothetical protein